MNTDVENLLSETVELTAVAEMWRDRAEKAEARVAELERIARAYKETAESRGAMLRDIVARVEEVSRG